MTKNEFDRRNNSSRTHEDLSDELAAAERERPSMTDIDDETVIEWERHKSRRRLAVAAVVEAPEE